MEYSNRLKAALRRNSRHDYPNSAVALSGSGTISVIEVNDLWKRFTIPHERQDTVVHSMAVFLSLHGKRRFNFEEFWALREVSFDLHRRDSLGIIGPNGSGKTTLLSIIAEILKADRGEVKIHGTIASLLGLGIGFHPELTVKENAEVYGVLMGMSRKQVKKRTGPILEFAGLTKFQDAKLVHLSSGMQVRLSFSIAIECDADIFLVDEALAVGDMEFQQKCLNRFRQLKQEGKSIVFVSHSLPMIESFCEKTLYLLKGRIRAFGPTKGTIGRYMADIKEGNLITSQITPA
jgi:ABC-type polysaccharide/polyol phosphate transport system ATPase subunit